MPKEVSGSFGVKDAAELVDKLETHGAILFAFSPDSVQAYLVTLVKDYAKLGILPFGGKVDGMTIVGIQGYGCHPFNLSLSTDLMADYVGEKLGMKKLSDNADYVTQLLNAIRLVNRAQPKEKKVVEK